MIVYVVQQAVFGDYGNGKIWGVFTRLADAERVRAKHGGSDTDTDLIKLELDAEAKP